MGCCFSTKPSDPPVQKAPQLPPSQPAIQTLPPSQPPIQHPPSSQSLVQQAPSIQQPTPVQSQALQPAQQPQPPVQQPAPVQQSPPVQKIFSSQPSVQTRTLAAFSPLKPIYPDYAVGIQEQKKEVMKLLDMERQNELSLAVVIYGFGGIGKTTLSTAVIADLDLTQYNYSGVEIHADRSRNDIKSLQWQILKDAFPGYTFDRNATFRNSAEGRDHLSSAFQAQRNKPVVLFIDNALRAEDLQELFPKSLAGLPKRSRIVLTTRNLGVTDLLIDAGLERRDYRVGTLPDHEALKILFKDENIRGRENMQKVLQICDGIPLVLEIVGARLRKQNYMVERCTQIFEALETGEDIKEENLSQRMVTSAYNELAPSTREAFLDICCFFANWCRRDVEYIVGAQDVTVLQEAALMKTSSKDELIVHDIIRAKGRSLSKSNRILDMQSWREIAHDDQKLKQIKGVWLGKEESESGHEVDEKQLHSLKNSLRVLCLESHIKISGSSQKSTEFKELRFLRLGGDISALWPANLESLERLTVFHGPIYKDGVTLYQLPKNLRVMRGTEQSHFEGSKPGKIIPNSSLEELDLRELRSFQKFPEKLDHLTALKILLLDMWDKIQELPEQVCGLRSLKSLSICGGNSLRNLPKLFAQLSSLQELILTRCKQLEELPSTFGDLGSLKELNLAECSNLKELPLSFGKLSSLEVLNLDSCSKLETFPSSFWELSSLTELRCSCLELKELPSNIENLISLRLLDLSYCTKLKSLPSGIGKLRSLKVLILFACCYLEELPSNIGELPSLKNIDLRGCRNFRECPAALRRTKQGLIVWLPDHLIVGM
ncbi:disease resistance protein RPV1-like [Cryptomeria japonica]|uniref:disease resistance protein RPV1-like n=1 Tax=Cryptomeria japonica TaxID=3369 RepID=UPI0027DA8D81|nr:disease resistance protein RPV1-like [Cryptomeria japonica]